MKAKALRRMGADVNATIASLRVLIDLLEEHVDAVSIAARVEHDETGQGVLWLDVARPGLALHGMGPIPIVDCSFTSHASPDVVLHHMRKRREGR